MPLKNLNYPQLVSLKQQLNSGDQFAAINAARILLNEFVDELMPEAKEQHERDQRAHDEEMLARKHDDIDYRLGASEITEDQARDEHGAAQAAFDAKYAKPVEPAPKPVEPPNGPAFDPTEELRGTPDRSPRAQRPAPVV